MTGWIKGQPGDRESLITLLRRDEWNHLHFSSALKEVKGFRLINDGMVYLIRDRLDSPVGGALYLSRGGALHCCFEPSQLRQNDLDYMERLLAERSFFSFIGREDRINLIEELYGVCDSRAVAYDLMVKERPIPLPSPTEGYEIRRANKDDFKDLYPLEEAYQVEEVLKGRDRLNEKFLKKRFLRQLGSQLIWAVYKQGVPVAKGGTNAVGFSYCQIGGVYTLPKERNRGIARLLMNHISEEIYREGWGTSLFVRKDNSAARTLYKNCGYLPKGNFRIVYPEGTE
jgi:uncharacterized protein